MERLTSTGDFDPYYKWLGIPAKDQPPHHYRLLGLALFESDLETIANAADARMSQIRTFQTGPHSELSQKLLNEIAAAKVCLLSPEKKAQYDAQLWGLLVSQGVLAQPAFAGESDVLSSGSSRPIFSSAESVDFSPFLPQVTRPPLWGQTLAHRRAIWQVLGWISICTLTLGLILVLLNWILSGRLYAVVETVSQSSSPPTLPNPSPRPSAASSSKAVSEKSPHPKPGSVGHSFGPSQGDSSPTPPKEKTIPENYISLIHEKPILVEAWNNYWGINTTLGKTKTRPVIPKEWQFCQEYLFAHAPSQLTYKLPSGMKSFTSIGYCAASGGSVSFRVLVDGKVLFESDPDVVVVPIRVDIPPQSQSLELAIDPLQNKVSDHSFWLYPRLHPIPSDRIASLQGPWSGKEIPLTTYPPQNVSVGWYCLVSKARGAKLELGLPLDTVPPVDMEAPQPCEEFLFAYAPSRLVYILPAGAKRFTAIGYCLHNHSVQFKVGVDGVVLYESPRAGIVNIDVSLPSGASRLELVVDDLGDNTFDWSFWCYPYVHRD